MARRAWVYVNGVAYERGVDEIILNLNITKSHVDKLTPDLIVITRDVYDL